MGKEARKFTTAADYAIGDLAIYQGELYEFKAAHTAGAWDDDDVVKVDNDTESEITYIIKEYDRAINAANYVDTLVMDPAQIDGTRYKYVLTSE